MPLRRFLTRIGVTDLISKVRVGGLTLKKFLSRGQNRTKDSLKEVFRNAVDRGHDLERFTNDIGTVTRSRKRQTLGALRGVMLEVRGNGRQILVTATGQDGLWVNRSVIDSRTSNICLGYVGETWRLKYRDIPDRPPRHPNCRSFLTFTPEGIDLPDDSRSFESYWEESDELKLDLLGPRRFEAYQSGDLKIRSFKDYEKVVLTTLSDLGL